MGKRARKVKTDPEYDKAFGREVREHRDKFGWTQADLAEHSSISTTQISVIENGHESPQLYTVVALANAFGKTPSQFLNFHYPFKLNTNFSTSRKPRKSGVTSSIKDLFEKHFFKSSRTVENVIDECKRRYDIVVMSSEVSGALLLLAKEGSLKKTKQKNGKNLYQNK